MEPRQYGIPVSDQKHRVKEYFDCDAGWQGGMYANPDNWFARSVVRRREHAMRIVDELGLPDRSSVLDAGFGSGAYLEQLALKGFRCSGLETSERMIEAARERLHSRGLTSVGLFHGDVENLPFKDESYDLVLSMGVLGYLPAVDKAAAEIRRVLKTGGFWITSVANIVSLSNVDYYFRRRIRSRMGAKRIDDSPAAEYSFVSPWILEHSPVHHQYRLFHPAKLSRKVQGLGFRRCKDMTFGFQLRLLRKTGLIPESALESLELVLEKSIMRSAIRWIRYAGDSYTGVFQKTEGIHG